MLFLFSQDFSTQFHFEHARKSYMSKVLDDPLDDPLIFFANHFAALSSEVDLWNLIFQARIDFWIDFSNGFSWLNFFVGLIGIWRVPIWVQYIYFKRSVRQHRYLFWNFKTSTGCVLAKNQQKKLYWRSTKNFCCLNKKQQTSVVFSQTPHAPKKRQEINETNIPQPTQPTQPNPNHNIDPWEIGWTSLWSYSPLWNSWPRPSRDLPPSPGWNEGGFWTRRFFWNLRKAEMMYIPYLVGSIRRKHPGVFFFFSDPLLFTIVVFNFRGDGTSRENKHFWCSFTIRPQKNTGRLTWGWLENRSFLKMYLPIETWDFPASHISWNQRVDIVPGGPLPVTNGVITPFK